MDALILRWVIYPDKPLQIGSVNVVRLGPPSTEIPAVDLRRSDGVDADGGKSAESSEVPSLLEHRQQPLVATVVGDVKVPQSAVVERSPELVGGILVEAYWTDRATIHPTTSIRVGRSTTSCKTIYRLNNLVCQHSANATSLYLANTQQIKRPVLRDLALGYRSFVFLLCGSGTQDFRSCTF